MENNSKFYSLWFSLICIFIFIIQIFSDSFTEFFMLTPNALSMPWQFITSIFLHGSTSHLLYNLFALIFFGIIAEKLIGSHKFLILFFASGILANIFSFMIYPNGFALGASGAIMGIIGCVAVLRPMMIVWSFSIPMPMFVLAIVWIVGSIMGIFGIGDQGVGHLAHLSGIIVGILYGLFLRLIFIKGRQSRGFFIKQKIILPEKEMRDWENYYFRK